MLLLGAVCCAVRAPSRSGPLLEHIRAHTDAPPVLLLDGNNIRGATVFATSQQRLCERVGEWAANQQLPCVLALDHGAEHRSWRLSTHAALTMSGGTMSADDVLVRDAWWLRHTAQRDVFIFTSDGALIGRLRQRRRRADDTRPNSVQTLPASACVTLLGLEDEVDGAEKRGESTATREHYAKLLAELLSESSADAADAGLDRVNDAPPSCAVLDAYLRWAESAPVGKNVAQTAGSGAPTHLQSSLKRRLRRKRARGSID